MCSKTINRLRETGKRKEITVPAAPQKLYEYEPMNNKFILEFR
jgi:hypothetical protein